MPYLVYDDAPEKGAWRLPAIDWVHSISRTLETL